MIQLEICIDIGGYKAAYIGKVANWLTWPVKAKLTLKMEPFTIDLKVRFESERLKMKFTVLKALFVRSNEYTDPNYLHLGHYHRCQSLGENWGRMR